MTELMVSLNCSGNTDSSCVFIVVTENVGAIVKKNGNSDGECYSVILTILVFVCQCYSRCDVPRVLT